MATTGAERLMLESRRRSLAIEIPKYKQHRVSAVRDFPPGCGPNALKADLKGNGVVSYSDNDQNIEHSAGDCLEVENKKTSSAVHDFPPGCRPDTPKADFRGNGAVSDNDNVQNIEHSAGDCLEVESKKTSSAAENPALLHGVDKSVDVVQKAGELELLKEENTVSDYPKVESMNTSSAAESSASLQGVDTSVHVVLKAIELELMNDDSFDGLENLSKSLEPTDMSEEVLPRSCNISETLQVNVESVTKELLHETQEPPKDLLEDKLEIPCVLHKDAKKISAQEETMVFSAVNLSAFVWKEITYPPRRTVSAIRDFPPGCGSHITASKKHLQVRPPKSSKEQCRMSELKSNNSVQREKLKVAYDRKMEKGPSEHKGDKKRKTIYLGNDTDLYAKRMASSDHAKGVGIQKGLMDAANRPMQQGSATSSCVGAKDNGCEKGIVGKKLKLKLKSRFLVATKDAEEGKEGVVPGELLRRDDRNSAENDRQQKHLSLVAQSHQIDVGHRPVGASSSVDGFARNKVRETLRLFQAVVRKLLQGEENNPKEQRQFRRVDLQASVILKEKGKYSNAGKPIIGHVPGVEVGDEFHYRVELMIIGLHRPPQAGIDSVKICERALATSVVDSGGYDNKVDDYDVWIYTGQGGNLTARDKAPEDQKLERGNLALKNSMLKKNHLRVIRGVKDTKPFDERRKVSTTYTYFGLYTVERYWQEIGHHGKKEYKFELKRVPGQRDLPWKEVKNSKKFKIREGRCVSDISAGKEQFPICAVNTIDDEKPPSFTYISRMIYPGCKPLRPRGCDCINGCLNSTECSCVVKNEGGIPYNYDGAIVEAKPLVYECGPSCKCPSSCHNKVSQHGIKFQLEIFKTESRGWGVRALSSIPSGSFICEYTGELLEDKEAEKRTGNDEYLFDIGQNCNDHSVWEGLSSLIPDASSSSHQVVADSGFTIDAAKCGNVGRFINHSCSPNLYAQNVLYDHGDTRMPHIMLFAVENIPPLQELTYHYNYKIGQVYDKDGNVKVKNCYCGSSNCSGRMY